jgi:hypothetical protein
MPSASGKIINHFIGLVAFAFVGFVIAIIYLLIVGRMFGRGSGMDGLALAASIVTFPMLAAMCGLLGWVPLWLLHNRRLGRMSAARALLLGLLLGLVVSLITAGGNGFVLRGGAPLFNYFFTLIVAGGAVCHNWIVLRSPARA